MSGLTEAITLAQLDDDPYPVYAQLRDREPVAWVPVLNAWFVTRWHDVRRVAEHPESFTTANTRSPLAQYCGVQNILLQEGDQHADTRASVDDRFARPAPATVSADVRKLAAERLRLLSGRDEADLMTEYFEPVTVAALGRFLGLDGIEPTLLAHWSTALTDALYNPAQDPARAAAGTAASGDIDEVVGTRLRELSARPDDSVLSRLLHSGCPGRLPRPVPEALATLKMMFSALREPSWLAGNTLYALLTHPDQLAALRADPALLGAAVHEGTRWGAPVGAIGRTAVKDVVLGGVGIPAGATVLSAVASANRDASVFSSGETFDLHRTPTPHLTLGYGRHGCLAAGIVPRVVEAALSVLLSDGPQELRMTSDTRPSGWKFRKMPTVRVAWH
ncbi:cytochrome P450 [Streptomyces sp. NPDC021093]|uniref:cytochrome P450 n=1 Tax=Streptomyces sp. NPDC021093 TaxID=3365112 RepID=UPI00378DE9F8